MREELRKELIGRGFSIDGASPCNTMIIDEKFLTQIEIAALLEMMVARREKVFRSGDAVGMDAAKESYDDVVLAIDAIKAVIGKLSLP